MNCLDSESGREIVIDGESYLLPLPETSQEPVLKHELPSTLPSFPATTSQRTFDNSDLQQSSTLPISGVLNDSISFQPTFTSDLVQEKKNAAPIETKAEKVVVMQKFYMGKTRWEKSMRILPKQGASSQKSTIGPFRIISLRKFLPQLKPVAPVRVETVRVPLAKMTPEEVVTPFENKIQKDLQVRVRRLRKLSWRREDNMEKRFEYESKVARKVILEKLLSLNLELIPNCPEFPSPPIPPKKTPILIPQPQEVVEPSSGSSSALESDDMEHPTSVKRRKSLALAQLRKRANVSAEEEERRRTEEKRLRNERRRAAALLIRREQMKNKIKSAKSKVIAKKRPHEQFLRQISQHSRRPVENALPGARSETSENLWVGDHRLRRRRYNISYANSGENSTSYQRQIQDGREKRSSRMHCQTAPIPPRPKCNCTCSCHYTLSSTE